MNEPINSPTQKPRRQVFLDEHPLVFLPSLAVAIGLDEAIIVQQIHYWVEKMRVKKDVDWVYNSYKDWQKQFPFFSVSHIRRTIKRLEDDGILISDNFNKVRADRTKWYTINYEKVQDILDDKLKKNAAEDENEQESEDNTMGAKQPLHLLNQDTSLGQNSTIDGGKTAPSSAQLGQSMCPTGAVHVSQLNSPCVPVEQSMCPTGAVHVSQLNKPIPEITTETSLEITTETNAETNTVNPPRAHDAHPHAYGDPHLSNKDPNEATTFVHPPSSQTSSSIPVDGDPDVSSPSLHPSTETEKEQEELTVTSSEDTTNPTLHNSQNLDPSTPPSGAPPSSSAEAETVDGAHPGKEGPHTREKQMSPKALAAAQVAQTVDGVLEAYRETVKTKHGIEPVVEKKDRGAVRRALANISADEMKELVDWFVKSGQWSKLRQKNLCSVLTGTTITNFKMSKSGTSRRIPVSDVPFDEIISYLNEKSGCEFGSTDPAIRGVIEARWSEGRRMEDFRKVIDNMTAKWGRDPKMSNFLRPSTIFSEKMGEYLGIKVTPVDLGLVSAVGYQSHLAGQEWLREEEERDHAERMQRTGSTEENFDVSCRDEGRYPFDSDEGYGFGMDLSAPDEHTGFGNRMEL